MNIRHISQTGPCSRTLFTPLLAASATVLCAFAVNPAHADTFGSGANQFTLPFVPIGNAGNANDTTGYGGVSYNYKMSVTDVSQTMLDDATALGVGGLGGGAWSGSQPAADVTWYQAAAFVNWLNTSQGYTAAYNLTYTSGTPTGLTLWTGANIWTLGGSDPFRNANAHYFLPSENEWYKAAYYDPNKSGGAGYWPYATDNNTTGAVAPTAVASGTTAGTAVYNNVASQPSAVDQSGGLSPYGTQGQTGNVSQWMETDFNDPTNSSDGIRGVRGGVWYYNASLLQSSNRNTAGSGNYVGFRVASVPEPSSTMLIISAGFFPLLRRRRCAARRNGSHSEIGIQ